MTNKNILYAGLYFTLALLLTTYFIAGKSWLYNSANDMFFSACIAAGKWIIQVIAIFAFLKIEKWVFLKRISFISFVGSAVFYLYYLLPFLPLSLSSFSQFVVSIFASVITMIILYYKAVLKTGLPLSWFWGWMICLTFSIVMQEAYAFKYA